MKKHFSPLDWSFILGLPGCGKKEKTLHPLLPPKAIGGTFTIGVEDGYPPYSFRGEDGLLIGFDIDLYGKSPVAINGNSASGTSTGAKRTNGWNPAELTCSLKCPIKPCETHLTSFRLFNFSIEASARN